MNAGRRSPRTPSDVPWFRLSVRRLAVRATVMPDSERPGVECVRRALWDHDLTETCLYRAPSVLSMVGASIMVFSAHTT